MYLHEDETLENLRAQWIVWWKSLDAWWHHDGNPKQPHVVLTKGQHSDGFFNCTVPAEETTRFQQMIRQFCSFVSFKNLEDAPTWVIGPAMGAVGLSRVVSHALNERGCDTKNGWADKAAGGGMVIKRHDRLGSNDRVLVVEDVTTTLGTIRESMAAVRDRGAHVVGCLCVLNRSPHTEVEGLPIISVVRKQMPVWTPEKCKLCALGSEALRPKEGGNWKRLHAN